VPKKRRGAVPQPVANPLTSDAVFLTLSLRPGPASRTALRTLGMELPALVRGVGTREPESNLSCTIGFGSLAWDAVFGPPRPAELHPFREIRSGGRHAVSTPGDVFFHIRADRRYLCFELESLILARLGTTVEPVDEVEGFRYFDHRGLIGFVDGTENPQGQEALDAILVGDEDPNFAGGSYVLTQKYLHDLTGWNAVSTEQQEQIIGRRKLSDLELSEEAKPSYAHNALTKVVENGREVRILRDNMPFGSPARGEYGTYFIGYSRSPRVTEQMLEHMVVGSPPGNYDRLLDFSRPVTGNLFFVPSLTFLGGIEPEKGGSGPAA
jgi:porphyrinogen peroxidase